METQTWLSCHNKFISAKNIIILSVSSDDFLHAILEVAEQFVKCLQNSVNQILKPYKMLKSHLKVCCKVESWYF